MSNLDIAAIDILNGTVQIVSAFVSRNEIPHDRVADFMRTVSTELRTSVSGAGLAFPSPEAVPLAVAAATAAPMIAAPSAEAAADSGVAAPEAAVEVSEAAPDDAVDAADAVDAVDEEAYRFAHLSRVPVVPVSTSVRNDEVLCLFDGVGKKMLKRYIRAKYGMEEHEYRAHFGLPPEYPLTAPGYSGEKSLYAKHQGLGTDRISKLPKAARQDGAARELAEAA